MMSKIGYETEALKKNVIEPRTHIERPADFTADELVQLRGFELAINTLRDYFKGSPDDDFIDDEDRKEMMANKIEKIRQRYFEEI